MNKFLNAVFLGIIGPQEIIVILAVTGVVFLVSLIPLIFYLITLQNTLNAISIENRRMTPGQVWLSLIPLFGLIWQIVIVIRLAESLKDEFAKRGIKTEEELPGRAIGLAYSILF